MASSTAISASPPMLLAIAPMEGNTFSLMGSFNTRGNPSTILNPALLNISMIVILVNHRRWVLSSKPEISYLNSPQLRRTCTLQCCALGIQATMLPAIGMTLRIFESSSHGSLRCSSESPNIQQSHEETSLKKPRSEEHTSELQSLTNLVCRLLLEKKKQKTHSCT